MIHKGRSKPWQFGATRQPGRNCSNPPTAGHYGKVRSTKLTATLQTYGVCTWTKVFRDHTFVSLSWHKARSWGSCTFKAEVCTARSRKAAEVCQTVWSGNLRSHASGWQ